MSDSSTHVPHHRQTQAIETAIAEPLNPTPEFRLKKARIFLAGVEALVRPSRLPDVTDAIRDRLSRLSPEGQLRVR